MGRSRRVVGLTRPRAAVLCIGLLFGSVFLTLVGTGGAIHVGDTTTGSGTRNTTHPNDTSGGRPVVQLAGAYPNPVLADDAGEFVEITVRRPVGAGTVSVSDGEGTVPLPGLEPGRVILSTAPNRTRSLLPQDTYGTGRSPQNRTGRADLRQTEPRIRHLPSGIALANSGEVIHLERENATIDTLAFSEAPEGEVLEATPQSGSRWRSLGATDMPEVRAGPGTVETFVLPDAPAVPTRVLTGAERRILLGGYTLTSERIAAELVSARERGVSVHVLVDGDPVGGMSQHQFRLLSELAASGVDVRAVGGERARISFHHAKYAVVDDRGLVTTENWKPSGTGGRSSRGWGVVTNQSAIVEGLVRTFRADAGWRDAIQWSEFRSSVEPTTVNASDGDYPNLVSPATLPVSETRLLLAPETAEAGVLRVLRRANESIRVLQMGIGNRRQPFLRETLAAARRGVEVKLLLSSAWYASEENRALVSWLRDRANEEDLPLEARVADPRGRFEKVHAKGFIVDDETVVLGSLNWNNHSARENREVLLQLESEAVAAYFRDVFASDWQTGPSWTVSVGLWLAVLLVVLLALSRAAELRFREPSSGLGSGAAATPHSPAAGTSAENRVSDSRGPAYRSTHPRQDGNPDERPRRR